MKAKNISEKVIGIGEATILPGETRDVPVAYESSPVLEIYKQAGFLEVSGKPQRGAKTTPNDAGDNSSREDGEALKKARLASLDGITEEGLAELAMQLGINPAECKDQADVLKKVKAALK